MTDGQKIISKRKLCTAIVQAIARLRADSPRIHCLTNPVALEFTANTLLAVGAEPSMTHSADEVASFVKGSGALVVNLGMLDPGRQKSIQIAIEAAEMHARPWVLDPAYAQISPIRLAFARTLIQRGPQIIRANRTEIMALSEKVGSEVEISDAHSLASSFGGTVAATGAIDLITDGSREVYIANGDPMMTRVTAVGCVISALTGAFLSVEPDSFLAAAIAITVAGIAGEIAAENAGGPGSFRALFIDALASLEPEIINYRIKLSKVGPS